ncbi:MAG: ComEC/Rec2 family competence protein [Clostridiales bacterium]|nr:ComEC/Rec2 family competence protein [Clostridiales bacterium]
MVNLRLFLYVAVFVIAGILSSFAVFINPIIGILSLLCVLTLPVILAFYHYGQGDVKRFITYLVVCLFVIASLVGFFGRIIVWQQNRVSGDFRVSGTISKIWTQYDGNFMSFELSNVHLDGKKVGGNLHLNMSIKSENSIFYLAKSGDEMRFEGFVDTYNLLEDGLDITQLAKNVRYFSKIVDTNAQSYLLPNVPTGMEKIREYIANTVQKYLSPANAALAIGMLIGDRQYMDADYSSVFSQSGFAHIIAVSGLNITFIAMILTWFFKRLKLHKVYIFLFSFVLVFFYTWLARFSPSVLRAFIMFTVFNISSLRGKWYDSLNSLGFTASILLAFNPLYLFDFGFILSFGATFSIILFHKTFFKSLSKFSLGKFKFARTKNAFSLVLSIQVFSVALTAFLIHKLSTYSIITNIIFQSLVGLLFISLMVLVPLAIFIPVFGYLLSFVDFAMSGFSYSLSFFTNLPFSIIYLWPNFMFVLLLLVTLSLCSRFVLKQNVRKIALGLSFVLYFGVFVSGLPTSDIKYAVVPLRNNQTIVALNKKKLYFGSISANANQSYDVLDFKINSLDSIFINDDSFINAYSLSAMRRSFGVRNFYVPLTVSVDDIVSMQQMNLNVTVLDGYQFVDCGDFNVGALIVDGVFLGYQLIGQSVDILITAQNINLSKFENEFLDNFDIVRSSFSSEIQHAVQIVDSSFFDSNIEQVFVVHDFPRCFFDYLNFAIIKRN